MNAPHWNGSRYRDPVCGIAGRVGPDAGDRQRIERMTATLEHRGPDEDGYHVTDGVELGMRRLAIIDVANGHQPATDESGAIQVILNGEIYNFPELRQTLSTRGHTLRSTSDTEVVAHAYEEWGATCLQHLHGMFALAIWDGRSRELLLARDRVGKKPLVYSTLADGGLTFASEARALLSDGLPAQPNFASLNNVLAFGYSPLAKTAFEGISALPPAHFLRWRDGHTTIERYWSLDWSTPRSLEPEAAINGALDVIRGAVHRRLTSERPLGVFLSGGIDSTVVAALASEIQDAPLSTFTASFGDPQYDESVHSQAVAEALGTNHHTLYVDADPSFVGDRLPVIFDQPFADSSAVPTYLLAHFARKHIVVALGGDGGDEGFAGYDRYLATPRLQRMNAALKFGQLLRGPVEKLASRYGDRRLHRAARALRAYPSVAERYAGLMALTTTDGRLSVWNPTVLANIDLLTPEEHLAALWHEAPAATGIDRMIGVDFASYLPGDLLVKADISTMASSLELRSPLLDTEVLEYAAAIPSRIRTRGGVSKYILKQIAYRFVPRELLDRPKMGFGVPRARWLRSELRELLHDTLLDTTATERGWFEPSVVAAMVKEHSRGRDRDSVLWPLLMIELWARRWID